MMNIEQNRQSAIITEIERHGAPVKRVVVTKSMGKSERRRGCVARLCIILDDTAPGWRAKDNRPGRAALKRAMANYMRGLTGDVWSIYLQASYSCLRVENGRVARYDDSGHCIGVYA